MVSSHLSHERTRRTLPPAGEVTWRYNQLLFDSSCYPVDRWLEDCSTQPWHLQEYWWSHCRLTNSVTIHQGGVTLIGSIVTAASALVNPYTMEGVESLCILLYTSINVHIVNGQRLKFNPVNGQSPENQRGQQSKC